MVFGFSIFQKVPGSLQDSIHTCGTWSFRHHKYFTLLLAGSLPQVTLILVALSIGATHRHVVIVALRTHRCKSTISPGVYMPLTSWKEIIIYKRKYLSLFSVILITSIKSFTLQRHHSKRCKSKVKSANQSFDSNVGRGESF